MRETDSPKRRTAFCSERAHREEMSSADFSDCHKTITSSLPPCLSSDRSTYFYPFLPCLLFSSRCVITCLPTPTSHALSTSSRACLSVFLSRTLTSYLLLSGQMSSGHRWRADGTHARLKRPQVEGRERKREICLGSVCLLFILC